MAKPPAKKKPFDPAAPFRKHEFRDAGHDVRRLLTGEFKTVFHGVFVLASAPECTLLRARAALRVAGPRAHASHHTAAELHDLCPPVHPSTHVSTPEGVTRTDVKGIEPHLANREVVVMEKHGIRISSPVQTFLDLAGHQGVGLVDLVVVGDRIVRKRTATIGQLIKAADNWRGHGARLARQASRLVRKGVDSPMETRLRLLIVLAGLPEPQVNLIMSWPNGHWQFRIDLSYPEQKIIIEYDGRQHAEIRKQWLHDIARREQLQTWKWHIVTVTSEGIFDDPLATLQRVHAVARERKVPGTPRHLNDEWRHYFASRAAR